MKHFGRSSSYLVSNHELATYLLSTNEPTAPSALPSLSLRLIKAIDYVKIVYLYARES